ncbi:hypothetical protein PT974_00320 [Cladobotryum mycophilum]|uniref:Uncharacterized protein n=1 Tax=Cladobotryum mycophilum TaxID=491253 RepID=A0ABR0T1C1_9HYPO
MAFNATAIFEQPKAALPGKVTCWTPAAGYVNLSNTQELGEALAIIKKTGSKFAIRTNSHNPNVVSSADETGIVLDIRQLQSEGLRRLGLGTHLGRGVCPAREAKTVGDREPGPATWTGRLASWGDMGALPNLHGLGADGIQGFENCDLYRALKGDGSNFVIVIKFDLETHPPINVQ